MRLEEALILEREDLLNEWKNWSGVPIRTMFKAEVIEKFESASVVIFLDANPDAWAKMQVIKNKYAPKIGYC